MIGFIHGVALSAVSLDGSPRLVSKRCFCQLKCRLALTWDHERVIGFTDAAALSTMSSVGSHRVEVT